MSDGVILKASVGPNDAAPDEATVAAVDGLVEGDEERSNVGSTVTTSVGDNDVAIVGFNVAASVPSVVGSELDSLRV